MRKKDKQLLELTFADCTFFCTDTPLCSWLKKLQRNYGLWGCENLCGFCEIGLAPAAMLKMQI